MDLPFLWDGYQDIAGLNLIKGILFFFLLTNMPTECNAALNWLENQLPLYGTTLYTRAGRA